jgi:hypothetical protein
MKILIAAAAVLAMTSTAVAQTTTQQTPPQPPPPAAAKPNADVTGKWDLTLVTAQGNMPVVLVLKKEAEKIVGTISSEQQGEVAVEGSVEDKALSVWFTIQTQNGPLGITLNGTVDGNSVKGMADFGGRGQAEWWGTRAAAADAKPADAKPGDAKPADAKQDGAKPAAIDVSGTWGLEVNTPAGTGTPTLVLNQDGEKLSGMYKSNQFGEAPITGTLKGNTINFAFDLNIEGNAVTVTYTGTVEKDTMSGSLKFGEYADGTFTGKKK